MNNYNLKIDIEPTNKYEKARNDLVEALSSFEKLSAMEQEQLVRDLFGVEALNMLSKITQRYHE